MSIFRARAIYVFLHHAGTRNHFFKLLIMDANSYLISPGGQYRQELRLIMNESEISDLYQVLTQFEGMGLSLPKAAANLKIELWYMLLEVREFNAYQEQGGEP